MNWTPGLDPKTGRPLNYNPNSDIQLYNADTHGTRAKPKGGMLCPAHIGGKNWEPSAYNSELGLMYIASRELQLPRNYRTEGLRRPGRHRQAARALPRRRRPASSGAPLRRPQGSRPRQRRD